MCRMRAFAAGYGMDDAALAAAMALVGDRCREVARFVNQRAGEGVPGFVRLVADGHDTMWLRNAAHADEQLPAWLAALAP